MTATINIHEAKTHFSKLIERVPLGEEIVIAKAGQPRSARAGETPAPAAPAGHR